MQTGKRFLSLSLQRLLLVGAVALLWWYAASRLPSFVLPGPEKV
ncbi:MAG: nitrate transporter permease, partial [Pseudomonas sp.]|nr:nitrate transporter permease [Pseudomonas sp.]